MIRPATARQPVRRKRDMPDRSHEATRRLPDTTVPVAGAHGPEVPASTNAQALCAHWRARRGVAVLPQRSAIRSGAISDLLPWTFGLGRRPDGTFAWRALGRELVDFFGRDLTGEPFEPGSPPRHDRRFLSAYTAVSSHPCGAVISCRARARGLQVALETLALPMLDDAGQSNEILLHLGPLDPGQLVFRQVYQVVDLRIEAVDFFDIGAGRPSSRLIWALSTLAR